MLPRGPRGAPLADYQVDSRTVPFTNHALFNKWIKDWGEESDYVRVRVRGLFPRTSLSEFMSREVVALAMQREVITDFNEPLVLGVDVARFGDDASVIWPRRGRDAKSIPARELRNLDTMSFAEIVVGMARQYGAAAVFIDGGGVGGGVVDRCRQLGLQVFDVQFGRGRLHDPHDGTRYADKRTEMWGSLRLAMSGLALPADRALIEQLCAPEYSFLERRNNPTAIKLESKDSLRARGLDSPDKADALALTYAYTVVPRSREYFSPVVGVDYDPYAEAA